MAASDQMKKNIGFFFSLILFWVVPLIASADPIDVNKYWSNIPAGIDPTDTTDSSMCWAAAASNVLTYTGWGMDNSGTSYSKQYDVYHEFLSHFSNAPGTGIAAYQSYFQWHPVIGSSPVIVQLYPDPSQPNAFINQAQALISQGYGLYLSLQIGHAVTLWSFGVSATGIPYITITDSDDYYQGTKTYEIVQITEGFSAGHWAIRNYRTSDGRMIEYAILRRIDALAPQNIVAGNDFIPIDTNVIGGTSQWFRVNVPIFAPGLLIPIDLPVFRYSVPANWTTDEPDGPYLTPEPPLAALLLPCLAGLSLLARFRKKSSHLSIKPHLR